MTCLRILNVFLIFCKIMAINVDLTISEFAYIRNNARDCKRTPDTNIYIFRPD